MKQSAEFIEEQTKKIVEDKIGYKFSPKKNYWLIDEIEIILNCYPILRKFNYKVMNLEQLNELLQSLLKHLEMDYSEENDDLIQ